MQQPDAPEIILEAALEIADEQERSKYLTQACGDDQELLREIESLISVHLADNLFMSSSPQPLWQQVRCECIGDTIGRYKLLQLIGEGGFGNVYMAEQSVPVRRKVALKVIKPGMDSMEIISRFETERQALALMDHPHISKVFDAGTTEHGRPYFVMELVNGQPITQYCTLHQLDTTKRLELFIELCTAVQHAHQKGIIHRDLKPSNILVTHHDGQPMTKVIDFGIAKAIGMELIQNAALTKHHRMIGTPQYMSPEQAESHSKGVDTLSDVYSLGVILYELLTGTTPLNANKLSTISYGEIQRLIHEMPTPKPSTRIIELLERKHDTSSTFSGVAHRTVQGDLDWITLKALEKDPQRRYDSASALAEDIHRFIHHKPVEARPPSMAYVMTRFARRHRGPVIFAATLLLALVMGAIGTSMGMKRALDAKEELTRKNQELDDQKLTLVDYKQRLSGLLESNQKMLGEISRMSTNSTQLPGEFETLRKENQELLDKVKNEVANQERYTDQIARMEQTNTQQREELTNLTNQHQQLQAKLNGLKHSIAMLKSPEQGKIWNPDSSPSDLPFDRKTGEITVPHTIVTLTSTQRDEIQTIGTITLTETQWEDLRDKSPQSPKRFTNILPYPWPETSYPSDENYVIELSKNRIAVPHRSDGSVSIADVNKQLYRQGITFLRVNERGQFYFEGQLIAFATLAEALSIVPEGASRDKNGHLLFIGDGKDKKSVTLRWLQIKLPAGAKPNEAVYHSRLLQLAEIADKIGLQHAVFD